MQSWELGPPPVASGSLVPLSCPSTPRSTESYDEEGDKDGSFTSGYSTDAYPWEKEDDSQAPTSTHAASTLSFAPHSSSIPETYSTSTPNDLAPDSPSV